MKKNKNNGKQGFVRPKTRGFCYFMTQWIYYHLMWINRFLLLLLWSLSPINLNWNRKRTKTYKKMAKNYKNSKFNLIDVENLPSTPNFQPILCHWSFSITPWKYYKIKGFLKFSGSIVIDQPHEMGYRLSIRKYLEPGLYNKN